MEIRRCIFHGIQVLDGVDQKLCQHGIGLLLPDRPVEYFCHKNGLCAFSNIERERIERNSPAYLLHQLNFSAVFMIDFKIENKEGLKKIGTVLLPRFPDSLHHKCLPAQLFGITMHHQARFAIFCGVQDNSPGFPDHITWPCTNG